MPARQQPFKAAGHGASGDHRAAMIECAIESEPRFSVERCELDRPGPSYTVDTLRHLRAREPGAEFVLLIGSDAAADLPEWRESGRIPELARVVVFGRAGAPAPALDGAGAVPVPAIEISATEIREDIGADDVLDRADAVPEEVAKYIEKYELYK